MSAIRVRSIESRDIVTLQELDMLTHGECWSRRVFLDEISLSNRHHIIVEVDGVIAGHAAMYTTDESAHITNVAVSPDFQRRSLASGLVLALCRLALARRGVQRLVLEVRPDNRAAQSLYRRFGFSPVGIVRNFYGSRRGTSTDAMVMEVIDIRDDAWTNRIDQIELTMAEGAVA